jgi:UDP:flavonoid glycosyltransferase YjiC (YdhE family)
MKQETIGFILPQERSAFNASFVLAKRLASLGYRVVYGGQPEFQTYVEAQGLKYYTIKTLALQEPVESGTTDRFRPLKYWLRLRRKLKQSEQQAWNVVDQCEALLSQEKPCLILIEPFLRYGALPGLKLGIPMIGFSITLAAPFNVRLPPAFSGLLPTCYPLFLAPARNIIIWFLYLYRGWFRHELLWRFTPVAFALSPRRSVNSLIRRNGGRVYWNEHGPCIDVPELVVAPRDFDFPQKYPFPRRIYVGGCVDTSRSDVDEFDWGDLNKDKPLLFCSLGTHGHAYRHSGRLFQAVIDALLQREDIQAVIKIGTHIKAERFGPMPPRIRLLERVPQLEILAHADIFITHGGLSSVREAIHFAVPMIVFPSRLDQPGNAARVVYHGLGLHGKMAKANRALLLDMLHRIQAPCFRDSILRMQKAFHEQESCQAAIDFIECFLSEQKMGIDSDRGSRSSEVVF